MCVCKGTLCSLASRKSKGKLKPCLGPRCSGTYPAKFSQSRAGYGVPSLDSFKESQKGNHPLFCAEGGGSQVPCLNPYGFSFVHWPSQKLNRSAKDRPRATHQLDDAEPRFPMAFRPLCIHLPEESHPQPKETRYQPRSLLRLAGGILEIQEATCHQELQLPSRCGKGLSSGPTTYPSGCVTKIVTNIGHRGGI